MHSHRLDLRLGDYRRVLLAAFAVADSPVALLTITGPGWDVLVNDPAAIRQWNRTAALRWRRLDRRVKSQLRREGLGVEPLARIAQRQRRGVDHLHLVLRARPFMRRGNRRYVELLKRHGAEYGFGLVDDPYVRRHPKLTNGRPNLSAPKRDMVFENPLIAGRYLVRYLGGSQLEAMLNGRDYSFRPLWVSSELTRVSKVTCTRLRRVRHAFHVVGAIAQGSRPTLPVWWRDLGERSRILTLLGPARLGVAG